MLERPSFGVYYLGQRRAILCRERRLLEQQSSFRYYALDKEDAIINLVNPLYADLGGTDDERMRRYTERVVESRPYELLVDKTFKIQ